MIQAQYQVPPICHWLFQLAKHGKAKTENDMHSAFYGGVLINLQYMQRHGGFAKTVAESFLKDLTERDK